ncbi:flagellar motor protein MotD [Fundidesulfovibrio butyratiphilus]
MLTLSELKKRRSSEDQDEGTWFVSLSDMLTLLLCFFILMVSVSHLDQERYKKVADSLEAALKAEKAAHRFTRQAQPVIRQPITRAQPGSPAVTAPIPAIVPLESTGSRPETPAQAAPETAPIHPAQSGPKPKSIDEIKNELAAKFSLDQNAVSLEKRDAGVAVTLKGAVLFDRASAELTPAALRYLDSIASVLLGTRYKVTVEGHTDSDPIQSFVFPSNWELSAARASRVARHLIDRGVARDRISVVGFADTKPVAPNTNDKGQPMPENQARNRRVVVLINP